MLEEALSTNDRLAKERTVLAGERTLLAYVRTSIGCVAAAATLIQFFEIKAFVMIGYALLPTGVLIIGFGFYRHSASKRNMERICDRNGRCEE